jgi:hypothetical protein
VIAQTSTAPELVGWTQLGVMGLVILAFLTGWVVSKSTHERAIAELDKSAERNAEMDRWMRLEVIPSLTRNTDVLQQVLEILRDQWRRKD